jgi:hypothetical protein
MQSHCNNNAHRILLHAYHSEIFSKLNTKQKREDGEIELRTEKHLLNENLFCLLCIFFSDVLQFKPIIFGLN